MSCIAADSGVGHRGEWYKAPPMPYNRFSITTVIVGSTPSPWYERIFDTVKICTESVPSNARFTYRGWKKL